MAYPTPLLDQIQALKSQVQESERQATLAKTVDWLEIYGHQFGIEQAYICGSVTRLEHFTCRSDVDITVEQINPQLFFLAMAHLSEYLERDVDIIELAKCHFGDRLRQEGIRWTAES